MVPASVVPASVVPASVVPASVRSSTVSVVTTGSSTTLCLVRHALMLSAAAPVVPCRAVATFMREALLEHTKRLAMATGAGSSA